MFAIRFARAASVQRGRISVVLAAVLVTTAVGSMGLTLSPVASQHKPSPSSLTAISGYDFAIAGYSSTGEVDVSAAVPGTPKAPLAQRTTAADLSAFVAQEPLSLDHSSLNDPKLVPAENPAPMAVASYD